MVLTIARMDLLLLLLMCAYLCFSAPFPLCAALCPQDFKFYSPRFKVNKRILDLCVKNHQMYVERRRKQVSPCPCACVCVCACV